MVKKISVGLCDEGPEVATYGSVRPVRLRPSKKRPARARKPRRKVSTPGGIHRRANKRMSW